MANTYGPQQIAGDLKTVYAESGLVDATPSWAILQKRYPQEESKETGDKYVFGISFQKDHGVTYSPSSGATSGPVTLNQAVVTPILQVQIEGYAIYIRSRLSYDAAAKASKAGKKAFVQAYGAVLKNMKESHQYRLELSLLYGRAGIGVVASVTGQVVTFNQSYWATGIWAAGLKDCPMDFYSTVAATSVAHATNVVVTAVDVGARAVTYSGTLTSVVAGDVCYFLGARTATGWNECAGLYSILSNTGVMFNIDAANDAWRSQLYAVGGNLSLTAILGAMARTMSYGLEKGLLLVAPEKFATLGVDEASLRRYTSSADANRPKRGIKGVGYTLGGIDVDVMAHPFIWQGFPMMLPDDHVHRIGATDITFGMPGSDEKMELHVADTTALELRSMSDSAIYIERPAQASLLSGVT